MTMRPTAIGTEVVPQLARVMTSDSAGHRYPAPTPIPMAKKIHSVRNLSRNFSLCTVPSSFPRGPARQDSAPKPSGLDHAAYVQDVEQEPDREYPQTHDSREDGEQTRTQDLAQDDELGERQGDDRHHEGQGGAEGRALLQERLDHGDHAGRVGVHG